MRVLQLVYTAVLTSEIADIRDEKHSLKRRLATEKTGPQEPPAQIKQLFHTIKNFYGYKNFVKV